MSDPSGKLIGVYEMDLEFLLQSFIKRKKSLNTETINFGNNISGTLSTCIEVRGQNHIEGDKNGLNRDDQRKEIDEVEHGSSNILWQVILKLFQKGLMITKRM